MKSSTSELGLIVAIELLLVKQGELGARACHLPN